MQRLQVLKVQMLATPDQQISLTDPDPLYGDAVDSVSSAITSRSPSTPHSDHRA